MTNLVEKIQYKDGESPSPTRRLLSLKPSEKSIQRSNSKPLIRKDRSVENLGLENSSCMRLRG